MKGMGKQKINKLRKLRKARGISVDEMAELLSVCSQTYYRYEREPNECPVGCAVKICEVLGGSLDEIFGEVKA